MPGDLTAVVELLLARGADVSAVDAEGKTPLALAEASGNERVCRLLRGVQMAPEPIGASAAAGEPLPDIPAEAAQMRTRTED
jgi:hypothetical protein